MMNALLSFRFATRLAMLVLLFVAQLSLAQDTPQTGAAADSAEQATDATEVLQQEEFIVDETEEEEESPDRFIPTEEISQDLGVSFPVDI
jgi:hypothetical protein